MSLDLICCLRRFIRGLTAEVEAFAANSPILHAGYAIFAMELPVNEIARIAMSAGPHLLSGFVVSAKDGDPSGFVSNPIGLESCSRMCLHFGIKARSRRTSGN